MRTDKMTAVLIPTLCLVILFQLLVMFDLSKRVVRLEKRGETHHARIAHLYNRAEAHHNHIVSLMVTATALMEENDRIEKSLPKPKEHLR